MRGAVLCGPRDLRFDDRERPKILEPTDATIRIAVTCVGSDLWPYRGLPSVEAPRRRAMNIAGWSRRWGARSN
jgi:threonine dehydrogenase-like Zn-dependent dehydrogenase